MRLIVLAAIIAMSACASDNLSLAPPHGVDFTGKWKLNEADSDNPLRLQQTANGQAAGAGNTGDSGGRGGGGRGGRGGRGGSESAGNPTLRPPATPSMDVLGESVGFPGSRLEIKQVGGIVAFTSDGKNQVCQPGEAKKPRHHGNSSDRDAPLRSEREIPPPTCGWSDKTLIVHSADPDEDRSAAFEERYSISEDGRRLVEEVSFKGGRSNGFTLSRVWDRVAQ
jgi:hypothetical protein